MGDPRVASVNKAVLPSQTSNKLFQIKQGRIFFGSALLSAYRYTFLLTFDTHTQDCPEALFNSSGFNSDNSGFFSQNY